MYVHGLYFYSAGGGNEWKLRNNVNSTMAVGLLSHFEQLANVTFNIRERREGRGKVTVIRSISSADGEINATRMKGRMHER